MITILPESESDVLAVEISGRLTTDDYDKLEPELDLRAEQDGTFDLLVELNDLEGLEPAAIRDDLSFSKKYSDDIGRMAIVTGETFMQRLADFVGKPFSVVMGVDMERFDDRVEAWKWLRPSRSASDSSES